jgi:hypothetical protein
VRHRGLGLWSHSRRRPASIAAILVAALGLSLTLSSNALAHRTGLFAEIDVKATNGYEAVITAQHWKDPRHHPKLWVGVEGSDLVSWSIYRAPAKVTRHHLKADLGEFGRINLRFHPGSQRRSATSEARKAPRSGALINQLENQALGCGVLFDSRSHGRFKGTIRFHGEGDYTRIRAHKAAGFVAPAQTDCSEVNLGHGVALDAGSGQVRFEADHFRGHSNQALFVARQRAWSGQVAINRTALAGGNRSSFTYGFKPQRARVTPRRRGAIAGSAHFAPTTGWTGSLSASFPGAPHVPLTGPEFSARLGHF